MHFTLTIQARHPIPHAYRHQLNLQQIIYDLCAAPLNLGIVHELSRRKKYEVSVKSQNLTEQILLPRKSLDPHEFC